jgi:hypothetical protein
MDYAETLIKHHCCAGNASVLGGSFGENPAGAASAFRE